MVVVFSAPARTDLLDILTYIAQDNVTAALVVVDEIEQFCSAILADNPCIGTLFETSVPDIRMFPKQSYNIFYRLTTNQFEIVRVLHHSRLTDSIL
jgi:plasmid stabilization system protein ParE